MTHSRIPVISPTMDAAVVDAARAELTHPSYASPEEAAQSVLAYLEEQVDHHGVSAEFEAAFVPEDDEPPAVLLEPDYAAQGWSERNANVLRLVAQIESGEA